LVPGVLDHHLVLHPEDQMDQILEFIVHRHFLLCGQLVVVVVDGLRVVAVEVLVVEEVEVLDPAD
jgi:hypothetical protein